MRNRCIPAFQVICFVMAVSVGPAQADIIHVPADQPTIQAGIDAAVNGDTVLVADGTYTGPGNRDIDFLGKAIIVRSEYGPDNCIVDALGSETDQRRCFVFQNNEGRDSILQGFTIRGGDMGVNGNGGGVECDGASPSILGNVITANKAYMGGGISVSYGGPLIAGNRIIGNWAMGYDYDVGAGGGIKCLYGSPEICGNTISENLTGGLGGGIADFRSTMQLVNNLISKNKVVMYGSTDPAPGGGGIVCLGSTITIVNCTITGNRLELLEGNGYGGGLCVEPPQWWPTGPASTVVVENSIIRGNVGDYGDQCHVGATISGPSILDMDYSNVEGGAVAVHLFGGNLVWGAGMIDAPALFSIGSLGSWYLSQTAAGQPVDSPCLDSGGQPASLICYDDGSGPVCLDELTTRTDRGLDTGTVDMGYHYPPAGSVTARLECNPSAGVLPFVTSMEVELANSFVDQRRRIAAQVDIQLAGGGFVSNWRAGYTNVNGGESYVSSWNQSIPALLSLVGDNVFTLLAVDVSPAPYNLPPYPPAGDSVTDSCFVTGIAP